MSDRQADSDPKPDTIPLNPKQNAPHNEESPRGGSVKEVTGSCTLLAQIPDVGEAAKEPDQGGDGRILSPGLSAKILVGGGVFLLLMAVMPFIFGGSDEEEGTSADGTPIFKRENPAPDAPLAPRWEGATANALQSAGSGPLGPHTALDTANDEAPEVEIGTRVAAPPDRQSRPSGLSQISPFGSPGPDVRAPAPRDSHPRYSPAEVNSPMAVRDRNAAPDRFGNPVAEQQYQNVNHQAAVTGDPNANPAYYQHVYRGRDPRQPDSRDGYANPPGQQPPYDPAPRTAQRNVAPAYPQTAYPQTAYPDTGYRPDYARQQRGDTDYAAPASRYAEAPRADRRYTTPAPRVADRRSAAVPDYANPSSTVPANEPGIARFKGIIEKPTVRTTHDGAGSSIY